MQAKREGGAAPHDATDDRIAEGLEVIRLLVKHGAKLEVKNGLGQTPLQGALEGKNFETVQILRQLGARLPTPQEVRDLASAAEANDLKATKRLLTNGANPNTVDAEGSTPLMTAALRGEDEIVQELLNHGAKPDYRKAGKSG